MEREQDLFYKLIEKAKEIKLTERERTSLFSAVDTFVKRNPIRTSVSKQKKSENKNFGPIKSPFNFDWSLFHTYGLRTAVIFLAVCVLGTGTSFAANKSLPGDFLYAIKVDFNEQLVSVFLTGIKQAQYEVDLTQRRIDELKKVAIAGNMTTKIQTKVASQIDSHITNVQKNLDALVKKGDLKDVYKISTELESTLQEGEKAALDLVKENVSTEQVKIVKDTIHAKKENSEDVREDVEEKISSLNMNNEDTEAIAKAKFLAVKSALELISKNIDLAVSVEESGQVGNSSVGEEPDLPKSTKIRLSAPSTLSVESVSAIQEDDGNQERILKAKELFEKAQESVKEGEKKLEEKQFNEAFNLFREAYFMAQVIQDEVDLGEDLNGELDKIIMDFESSLDLAGEPVDVADKNSNSGSQKNPTLEASVVDGVKASR